MTIVSLDLETQLIRPGWYLPKPVCVSWFVEGDDAPNLEKIRQGSLYQIRAWCEDPDFTVVGHNIAFDMGCLVTHHPEMKSAIFAAYDEGRILCTYVGDKLRKIQGGIHNRDAVSLAELVREGYGYTLAKGEDTWRLRYGELENVPLEEWPQEAKQYALDDAFWSFAAYEKAKGWGLPQDEWARQSTHAFWTKLMCQHGVVTDPAFVDKAVISLKVKLQQETDLIREAKLLRPDGTRDTKAAKAIMVSVNNAPKLTDTGQISLDEEACRKSGNPVLKAYASYSTQKTQLQRLETLYNSPIQTDFVSLVDSGRMSCRIANLTHGFQLHNPPRKGDIRGCFVPRPGRVFLTMDLDTAELRALAQIQVWLFGQSTLGDVLNEGQDPHWLMACTMSGKEVDADGDERQFAKIPNFGLPGGLGAATFVQYARNFGHTIDESQAQHVISAWHRQWPEMRRYFKWINGLLGHKGSCDYKQWRSGRVRGDLGYTEACNTGFQGLVADAIKDAAWSITQECYDDKRSVLYDSRIWNVLHDEILMEVPEENAAEVAARASTVFLGRAGSWMPDVKPKTTPVLMRRWYKGAKPAYVDGKLVPSRKNEEGKWVHDYR